MRKKQELKFGIQCMSLWISLLFMFSCATDSQDINVELSTSGCYKTCPVLDIKLNNDKVLFNFIKYTEKEGIYSYSLTPSDKKRFNELLSNFNITDLEEEYTSNRVDMQVYSVMITKNGVTKKVYYYENDAPKELEALIIEIIKLKNFDLEKSNDRFKVITREEVPIIKVPAVPPPPEKSN